jgi:Cu/Ag efflux pump CusA
VLSGLVCSTIVTLTVLPAALVELLQWRERRRTTRAEPMS